MISRGVNRAVMEQLVRLYRESHLGKRLPAYDGRKSLYTAGPLPFMSKEFRIVLVDDDEGAGGQRFTSVFITDCFLVFDFIIVSFYNFLLYSMQEGQGVQGCDKIGCTCRPSPFGTLFTRKAN